MSAPTLPRIATTAMPDTYTSADNARAEDADRRGPERIRAAHVRFCDREDAEMFLEWLQARSLSRGSAITLGLFVGTAADAFSVSSALTGAEFAESDTAALPREVRDLLASSVLPPAIGPFESDHGWEIMHVMSMR